MAAAAPALNNSSYAPGKQLPKPVADLDRNDLQRLSVQPYSGQYVAPQGYRELGQ
jgi:hypothetical protein